MSNIIMQICSQFAISVIIRIVYTILFAVIRFRKLEIFAIIPAFSSNTLFLLSSRWSLATARQLGSIYFYRAVPSTKKTNDLLTIAAKFPGEVFDW